MNRTVSLSYASKSLLAYGNELKRFFDTTLKWNSHESLSLKISGNSTVTRKLPRANKTLNSNIPIIVSLIDIICNGGKNISLPNNEMVQNNNNTHQLKS